MCYEIKLHISINMLKHSFVIPLTYTTYLIVSNESSEYEAISVDMLLADVDPRSLIGFKWTNACLLNLATYWSKCLSWNIAHLNFKLQMVFWTYEMLIIFTISLFILCVNNNHGDQLEWILRTTYIDQARSFRNIGVMSQLQ